MAVHPNKKMVATGCSSEGTDSKMVSVIIWDVETQAVLAELGGFHQNAITGLEFSLDGNKLLTVGGDKYNSLALYDSPNSCLQAATRVGFDPVKALSWRNDEEFMTVDSNNIRFYSARGTNLVSQKGSTGVYPLAGFNVCGTFVMEGKMAMTGRSSGQIFVWTKRGKVWKKKSHQGHNGSVNQIISIENGKRAISGCSSGYLKFWSTEGDEIKPHSSFLLNDINTMSIYAGMNSLQDPIHNVCSLDYDMNNNTLLIATKSSVIFEIVEAGKDSKLKDEDLLV